MAVAFKGRICHLLSELFADASVFFLFFSAAGAVSVGAAKALFYRFYKLPVGIKRIAFRISAAELTIHVSFGNYTPAEQAMAEMFSHLGNLIVFL